MIYNFFKRIFLKIFWKKQYYYTTIVHNDIKYSIKIKEGLDCEYILKFSMYFYKTINRVIKIFEIILKESEPKFLFFYNISKLTLDFSNSIIDYRFIYSEDIFSFMYLIKNKKGKFEWY